MSAPTGSGADTDLIVLGGGPGGYVAAIRAAAAGMAVVLVEEAALGGVCLNEGCIPSKALIHAAEITAGHGMPKGLGPVIGTDADMAAIRHWQTDVVDRLRAGVAQLLKNAGVTVLRGRGRLDGPERVVISGTDNQDLTAPQRILATGSTPRPLPVLPFDDTRIVSSTHALSPPDQQGRVVVVGAGYIGLELASAYRDLGWHVCVVEIASRVLPTMDPALASLVHRDLTSRQVEVLCDHQVVSDDGTTMHVRGPDGDLQLEADLVIVAVGRSPRTHDVGLQTVGNPVDEHGFVRVDDTRRTAAQGLYAIGDVTPGPALAHTAMHEGTVAAEVAAGLPRHYRPAAVPAVVYTRPELATVGLTHDQASERGIDAQVHQVALSGNARALTLGAGQGLARLVVARERGVILGAQLAGPGVGELIGTLALAIEMGATVTDVAATIYPHPSVSEVLGEVALLAEGTPHHTTSNGSRNGHATT